MKKYKAIYFSPDGDWVTDCRECLSVEEVWECIADRGSRWFFFPFPAVIIDKGAYTSSTQKIVDIIPEFKFLKGKTIKTVSKFLINSRRGL